MADKPILIKVAEKIVRWLLFSVVLSLVPLFVRVISNPKAVFTWDALTPNGELLLIAITLCAASIGDIFVAKGTDHHILGLMRLLGGSCALIIIILSALIYGINFDLTSAGTYVFNQAMLPMTWYIYGAAIINSLTCVSIVSISEP